MENCKIETKDIVVEVSSFGAEITSIVNKNTKKEYLWNADEKYWKRHSPILFPFVGSLKNKEYIYKGKKFAMGQHGFARDMEFTLLSKEDDSIWFALETNEESYKLYPFWFKLSVGYELEGSTIKVLWKVENLDNKEMYFSIGAHPAFYCPFHEGEKQSQCYIKTNCKESITYYKINDAGLKNSNQKYILEVDKDGIFKITEHMFDDDALIIEDNQIHELSLLDSGKKEYVKMKFDMPLCGIWSPAKKNAPFVCLEPWSGRCDDAAFNGELKDREYGHTLKSGEIFEGSYEILIL